MSTIKYGELINQDLLDENGLRKAPYDHEKLTKDERKVVIRFTDQSYLKVVLVNGQVVRLRELRENIYRWFPELRTYPTGPTFRAERTPSTTLPRNRVKPDATFKKQIQLLVDLFTISHCNLIDKRRGGRVSSKTVIDDFQQMETLADIAILLEKVTIAESTAIFNELYPRAKTDDPSYLWLRTAFLTRHLTEGYLLNSIRRALLPVEHIEFDDEARRLQLNVYMDYRKYLRKKIELIDRPEKLSARITEISEASRQRILAEQIKSIGGYGDRVMVRMQYLLIEKVLKPLQSS